MRIILLANIFFIWCVYIYVWTGLENLSMTLIIVLFSLWPCVLYPQVASLCDNISIATPVFPSVMQEVSRNLKLKPLFVSFLVCVAALPLTSVLFQHRIYFTAFGVNCRKVNPVLSVGVLAHFTTVGLRQSCITWVKVLSSTTVAHTWKDHFRALKQAASLCSWLRFAHTRPGLSALVLSSMTPPQPRRQIGKRRGDPQVEMKRDLMKQPN